MFSKIFEKIWVQKYLFLPKIEKKKKEIEFRIIDKIFSMKFSISLFLLYEKYILFHPI